MAVIIIEDNVWLTIVYNSPLAPQRVRFAPQNRLLESAECSYEIMTWLMGEPTEVKATAVFGPTGVDVTDHVLLRCPGKEGAADMLASCESSFLTNIGEGLVICGSAGRMVVPTPHFGSEVFVYDEQGNQTDYFKDEITENGFAYEAQEVVNCVRAGKIESEIVPHRLTIACAEVFDQLMKM